MTRFTRLAWFAVCPACGSTTRVTARLRAEIAQPMCVLCNALAEWRELEEPAPNDAPYHPICNPGGARE